MISVVLPVYNERDNLEPLLAEVEATLNCVELEVIAVDDRSTDGSLEELRRLRLAHECLRVVSLEQHSGQSAAFAAGVELARGDPVVLMDADGQNDPADVPALLEILEHDPDCAAVVGYRVARADSRWKRLQSRVANDIRNWLTGDRVRDTGCSLKVFRRETLRGLVSFDGMHRFFPTLIRHAGGKWSRCLCRIVRDEAGAVTMECGTGDLPHSATHWVCAGWRRALHYESSEETD